jgi:BON domain
MLEFAFQYPGKSFAIPFMLRQYVGPKCCARTRWQRPITLNALANSFKTNLLCVLAALTLLSHSAGVRAQERKNFYNDPFLQVTNALKNCPVPETPQLTEEEIRTESHARAERGTRCYAEGRCRLPNSYLYDQEIIPRVKKLILNDAKLSNTSVWIEGQRRWVYLKGCVNTAQQSRDIERAVRRVDDVEAVINQLMIGVADKPPYRANAPSGNE